MENDFRQRHAPRRNKRYAHIRGCNEEAKRADALDWRNNDHDFYRLTQSILEHLDSEYRGKWGLCVHQLASAEEFRECFRVARASYEEEEALFQRGGIFVFLRLTMDLWLGGRACDALDKRRDAGYVISR